MDNSAESERVSMKSAEKVRLTGGRVEKETSPGKCTNSVRIYA